MKQKRWKNGIMLLCMLAAMAAAVLVRLPAARLSGVQEDSREVYLNEAGIPYMTDPDSYYHARMTDQYLQEIGALPAGTAGVQTEAAGAATADDDWDSLSGYPEGRAPENQPGIGVMTAIVWNLARWFPGADPYAVKFYLPAVMAALTALAAFVLGRRMGGNAGGLTAGILTSCGVVFTGRALPGRFDTDMFTVVMGVLLVLCLTEALRACTRGRLAAAAVGFALTAVAYSFCWSVYALVFSLLTLAGGGLYLVLAAAVFGRDRQLLHRQTAAFVLCAGASAAALAAVHGPSFFRSFLSRSSLFQSLAEGGASSGQAGDLPDLYRSITELRAPQLLSADPKEWLPAYIPGKSLSIVGGIGGGIVFLLCMAALAWLALCVIRSCRTEARERAAERAPEGAQPAAEWQKREFPLQGRDGLLYACVLGVWLLGGLVAARGGIRFVEHLSVPAGALAGACIGWLVPDPCGKTLPVRVGKLVLTVALCIAAVLLPVQGAIGISRDNRPSVSDASAHAMDWIRAHAEDPEAVIASWWDLGYYYAYASGHPVLWDGGSQSAVRAILIGKVLTGKDPALSQRILRMLAASGNAAVEQLCAALDTDRAFQALWETLPLDKDATCRRLTEVYGLTEEAAAQAEACLHPAEDREIYLITTGLMMNQMGWIEYFGNWDFSGTAAVPHATVYSVTPDGTGKMDTEDAAVQAFFEERKKELLWRLYAYGDGGAYFTKMFEENDGMSVVQVWRVE